MRLIIGLWNPWKQYRETRHNMGFLFLDWFINNFSDDKWIGTGWKKWFKWQYITCNIGHEPCILLKPETYMNLSWESVRKCADFYKITPDNCLIISDDIDMDFGKVRYRDTWSGGWHNGIQSIIDHLWTVDIPRIKIGIGRHPELSTSDWVLSSLSTDESTKLEDIFIGVKEKLLEKLDIRK